MPAQDFLSHVLLESGITSKLTWETVGRRLYDYFAFLNANGLRWVGTNGPMGTSPVTLYRDWSVTEIGLSPKTINSRLALVVRFYDTLYSKGEIP